MALLIVRPETCCFSVFQHNCPLSTRSEERTQGKEHSLQSGISVLVDQSSASELRRPTVTCRRLGRVPSRVFKEPKV